MHRTIALTALAGVALAAASVATAEAGVVLSAPLGGSLPIAEGGLFAFAAAAVAAGVWLAKRKDD